MNSGGSAARASAAQFNAERREAEQTARFLASGELDDGGIGIGGQDDGDVEIKDNESGVGMSCSAEVESKEKVQEKRIGKSHLSTFPPENSRRSFMFLRERESVCVCVCLCVSE